MLYASEDSEPQIETSFSPLNLVFGHVNSLFNTAKFINSSY